MLISNKVDFKTRNTPRDKEGNFISVKESVRQEDTTTLNVKDGKRRKDYCKPLYAFHSVAEMAWPKERGLGGRTRHLHSPRRSLK